MLSIRDSYKNPMINARQIFCVCSPCMAAPNPVFPFSVLGEKLGDLALVSADLYFSFCSVMDLQHDLGHANYLFPVSVIHQK